jgi:hypothetical protein
MVAATLALPLHRSGESEQMSLKQGGKNLQPASRFSGDGCVSICFRHWHWHINSDWPPRTKAMVARCGHYALEAAQAPGTAPQAFHREGRAS